MNRFNINATSSVVAAALLTVPIFTGCLLRDENRVNEITVEEAIPDSIQAYCATLPERPYLSRLPAKNSAGIKAERSAPDGMVYIP